MFKSHKMKTLLEEKSDFYIGFRTLLLFFNIYCFNSPCIFRQIDFCRLKKLF